MSNKIKMSVIVSVEADEIVDKQEDMSVTNVTHLLVGGIAMLIKSCGDSDMGIKDHELMEEVLEHLNLEFSSYKSFDDLYINKKYITKEKNND
jgi:hypothetical protein